MSGSTTIDPRDPVFISYRHFDGIELAGEIAWLLRAAGIPVWRDLDDLPPGDTDARLAQAIDDGISGAVIVITPDIINSRVVREVEAPRLLHLHRTEPEFALGIVNAVTTDRGTVDYAAPDRVLALARPELAGVDQRPGDRNGFLAMTRQILWHRVAEIRRTLPARGGEFRLSLQTRNTPQVYDRTDADLDIRLRPSNHEKLPAHAGLTDLVETARLLPDAVTRSQASSIRVQGGGHLAIALALGAAIPATRIGPMSIIDRDGVTWTSTTDARLVNPPGLRTAREGASAVRPPADSRPEVAIYLDLQHPRSDAAFDRFLQTEGENLVAWQHIVPFAEGLLEAENGGDLAAEAVANIRELSMAHDNAIVHLLYRGPFALGVLIGRLMNTLRVVVYEWDDSDAPDGSFIGARYEPIARIRASTPSGVIEKILIHGVDGI